MEGVDYVVCKICEKVGRELGSHIRLQHMIETKEYIQKYQSKVLCTRSHDRRSRANKNNGDWIRRKISAGEDLSDWKKSLGERISDGIMKSQTARQARKENLTRLNKTDEFRERSRHTAKRTSSRPDIIKKRTECLRRWRQENPEEFYEKCTVKMHQSYTSEPERQLFDAISEMYPDRFKRNQQLRRIKKFKTTKSGKRQIDIMDHPGRIIVEFDGPMHFKPLYGMIQYQSCQEKDRELNAVMTDEGWTVIRVGHTQFSYREGFRDHCVNRIKHIIDHAERGLFLLGEEYNAESQDD